MKTATVRDLRLHFANVAKWLDAGEEVAVTRRGLVIATLSPPKPPAAASAVDWSERFQRRAPVARRQPLDAGGTADFLRAMKRDF